MQLQAADVSSSSTVSSIIAFSVSLAFSKESRFVPAAPCVLAVKKAFADWKMRVRTENVAKFPVLGNRRRVRLVH